MRMWMISPALLCRKHLLGEHAECHMLAAAIRDGRKLDGYARNGLIEPTSLYDRHVRLATEMRERGYKHDSPLMPLELCYLPADVRHARVISAESAGELFHRCPECRKRMVEWRG